MRGLIGERVKPCMSVKSLKGSCFVYEYYISVHAKEEVCCVFHNKAIYPYSQYLVQRDATVLFASTAKSQVLF